MSTCGVDYSFGYVFWSYLKTENYVKVIIGDVYDFMIFSEIFNLIQECAEEKHKIIDVPIMLGLLYAGYFFIYFSFFLPTL